jgi:tetratricopeptide (TPR) repeat protein
VPDRGNLFLAAPPRSRRWLECALVAVVLFVVYARGAAPTIFVGDSGELVAAAGTLGIPHPSGYPLYVLAGKLWTLLVPVGSVAYRMSLFSAAAAAAACALLYGIARSAGVSIAASLVACGLAAFGPSFWGEANIQRVYALNAVFLMLATAATLSWHRDRSPAALALGFLACGLGASNHTFMAIVAVALAAYIVVDDAAALGTPSLMARRAAIAAGAFAIGLLPYLYLPLRSRMDPRLDWGNPETFTAFLDVVFRRDFWERAWIESPADLVPIIADYLVSLARESAWLGAAAMVVGVVAGRRRKLPVGFFLLVMAGNLVAMALHGSRSDIFNWHRYYIPSYLMLALLAGVGVDAIGARIPARARWAALALPLFLYWSGRHEFDRSRYRVAEDFAYAVLDSLPPGAHLIATDDNVLFVLIYLHLVEGRRPDVDLILQGVGKADLPPLRFDPDEDPLFFTHHPNWDLPQLEIVPVGVVYRAWRRGREWPAVFVPRTELDGEKDPRVPKDYLTQNLIGHFHYTLGFSFEQRDWLRAREEFHKAALASPDNDVLFYNLGLVYARNGLYDDALAAFVRSHEINPRRIASLSKADAGEKVAEVQAELARVHAVVARLSREAGRSDGSPADDDAAIADLLEKNGEQLAARGYRLRALVAGAR